MTISTDATSTRAAAPSGGIVPALVSLFAPDRFETRRPAFAGVSYLAPATRRRGVAPLADVYLPSAGGHPGPLPSVILVHGGGFVIGSRTMKPVRFLATRLCEAGYAALAIDYRLIFRGGRLAEALGDVRAAAAWWAAQAGRYGLDTGRISIAGLSAGATLALLCAAGAGEAPAGAAPPLHRVVSIFGVTDFAFLEGRLARFMRRLLLGTTDPAALAARSPLAACDMATPVLLLHGDADAMVPIEHARRLAAVRAERGLPVELRVFEGAPHAFLNDARRPVAQRAVEEILRFLGPQK